MLRTTKTKLVNHNRKECVTATVLALCFQSCTRQESYVFERARVLNARIFKEEEYFRMVWEELEASGNAQLVR